MTLLLTLSAICLLAAILYAAEECREDALRARQRQVVDAEWIEIPPRLVVYDRNGRV